MKMKDIKTIQTAIKNLKDSLEKLVLNEQDMNLIIHNRVELNYILETIFRDRQGEDAADEIFFIVEIDGEQKAIFFLKDEEENRWHEYYCIHRYRKMPPEDIPVYMGTKDKILLTIAKAMYRDGIMHQIDGLVCAPFLDREFKVIKILTEPECLDWILACEKEHNIIDIEEFRY